MGTPSRFPILTNFGSLPGFNILARPMVIRRSHGLVTIAQRSCEFRIAKGEHFSIAPESAERSRESEKKAREE
jgi:hypothetical protein